MVLLSFYRPPDFNICILERGVSGSHFPAELTHSESWWLLCPGAVWSLQREQMVSGHRTLR